jgi:hypothetical protein
VDYLFLRKKCLALPRRAILYGERSIHFERIENGGVFSLG